MPTPIQIQSVTNNGDGTFNVVFQTTATWDGNTTQEKALVYNNAEGDAAAFVDYVAQVDAQTIQFAPEGGFDGPGAISCTGLLHGLVETASAPVDQQVLGID